MIVYTYRAIIYQFNLHHCLKDTILDSFWIINLLHFGDKVVVKLSGLFACCSAMEIRLGPPFRRGE